MSDSNSSSGNVNNRTQMRNLPSWMNSGENGSKPYGMKTTDTDNNEENQQAGKTKQAKGHDKAHTGSSLGEPKYSQKYASSSSSATNFSKLMEGVVFVLSGFVNPERSTLRSQAIEMGADYQADWNSDCTLLVCAFPNTPKFRQVKADCGTIVSKEWILECHNQKKLVDIDTYLMHAGKPWRRSNSSHKTSQEHSLPRKSQKVEKASPSKPTSSVSGKSKASSPSKEKFPPSELKKWALGDLNKTITWLESQEEKPEQSEIKQIAAEGILTCLQDVIDFLEQKQGIQQITEQWLCVPRVVEELAKLEGTGKDLASFSNEDLCKQAKACKQIYKEELHRKFIQSYSILSRVSNESPSKKSYPILSRALNESPNKEEKGTTAGKGKNGRSKTTSSDVTGYDSEETIEMTEEEIELAYKTVTS